jgi:hypothetical protein
MDTADRRRLRTKRLTQAKLLDDELAQSLQEEAGARRARRDGSFEHLDVVSVTRQQQRDGGPDDAAADDPDLHARRNVLVTAITIRRSAGSGWLFYFPVTRRTSALMAGTTS